MTLDELVEKVVTIKKQRMLLLIISIAWMFDAAGVMVMSFTLPSMLQEWKLTPQQGASLSSATFIGMLIGALSVGFLADLFGRKISNVVYLLFTIGFTTLSGFSNSPSQYFFFRVLAGIGYGGLMPSVNAYLSEFTGKQIRGKYLVILEASWAVGSILIGLFSVLTLQSLGWRWSYWIFAVGFALLPIFLVISESPKFAFLKKGKEGLEKVLKVKIDQQITVPKTTKSPVISVLSKDYLKITLVIWTAWFVVSFVYYTLFTWAPKIFAQQGIEATKSLWYTFFMMVAQLPGYLSAAYFIERLGRKTSLAIYFFGMGLSAILWAYVTGTISLVVIALVLSFFTLGVWGLVYAYTPELYPTSIRGSGNGLAGVIARIAGILAPQYGGFMLQRNASLLQIFSILAILPILAGVVVTIFGVETKGKEIG
ncbi:MFS transporter [Pseudothermotoga thermarum]|uniref:Major facilitator superfamily MFS_1 n=1 Tax=Pseudothermotoga thermarum DSM 5069 TaxID=688269 RepID=F7YVR2_9THEM|nr:MFS transporter [Pseudothermotoga thermarum]AEH51728.1 major facilitator superfamily MFS_1 [Pseudothermotoga thermarum DSM 5069]